MISICKLNSQLKKEEIDYLYSRLILKKVYNKQNDVDNRYITDRWQIDKIIDMC